jgi:lipid-binding SYLF domain-containing protein
MEGPHSRPPVEAAMNITKNAHSNRPPLAAIVLFATAIAMTPSRGFAASGVEIDARVESVLETFRNDVDGGKIFLRESRGVLVFPHILKGGFGFGVEFGEGAMRVRGKTVDYYNTVAGSFGLQMGAQSKAVILCFMTRNALDRFRESDGWEMGVDGSVALATLGAGESIDSNSVKDPIVAFVFNNKGLMYNLTFEGSKMTRIKK